MFTVYFGPDKSEYFEFPVSITEIDEIFNLAENNEVKILTAYIDTVPYINKYLKKLPVTRQTFQELNFIGNQINMMSGNDHKIFDILIEMSNPQTLKEIVNLICNIDGFDYKPNIKTYDQLGKYVVPFDRSLSIMYEDIGKSYAKMNNGFISDLGYIEGKTGIRQIYDGHNLPELGLNSIFLLSISSRTKQNYLLSLPCEEDVITMAKQNLDVTSFKYCDLSIIKSCIPGLMDRLPFEYTLEDLNEFAFKLQEWELGESNESLDKIYAIIEAENPSSLVEALNYLDYLDDYELHSEINTHYDFAIYTLKYDNLRNYPIEELSKIIDFEKLGKYMLNRENSYAALTSEGVLIANSWPFYTCDKSKITKYNIYSPLKAYFYRYDNPDDANDIDVVNLCKYKDKINGVLCQEIDRKCKFSNVHDGIRCNIDHKLLKYKLISIDPRVEVVDGKLFGVQEVKSTQKLNQNEKKYLNEFWESQCKHGFGKIISQYQIFLDEGVLHVNFWNPDDFFTLNKNELKQMLGEREEKNLSQENSMSFVSI